MNPERKKQFNELRKRLNELTEDQKLEFVARVGGITNTEGKVLSQHNTILLVMQRENNIPTVVGGYRQWQKAGRQVMKGEHGLMIWYPSPRKNDDSNGDGDDDEKVDFYIGTVFDISQTKEKEVSQNNE